MSKGLLYWNERWMKAPSPGEGSWEGDRAARELELAFILKHMPQDVKSVLELGCGAGALFEPTWPGRVLRRRMELLDYLGLDGSEEAIRKVRTHCPGNYVVVDLEQEGLDLKAAYGSRDMLLCRRILQNLSREARGRIISQLRGFKHGVLLEGTKEGLERVNQLRTTCRRELLKEPEFNDFLTRAETDQILCATGGKLSWPLSTYYAITRGVLGQRNVDEALEIALRAPEEGGFGIIGAIVW